jgi:hypothetical protein
MKEAAHHLPEFITKGDSMSDDILDELWVAFRVMDVFQSPEKNSPADTSASRHIDHMATMCEHVYCAPWIEPARVMTFGLSTVLRLRVSESDIDCSANVWRLPDMYHGTPSPFYGDYHSSLY